MKQSSKISPRFILSGGGTGGHIYPAIAIANTLKARFPHAQFLFIGAQDKMEMQKVPKAGYDIKGLNIAGIQRDNLFKNITLPFKVIDSLIKTNKIIKDFKPNMVIGTGGYASGPTMWAAAKKGIPVLIQEQNSFPGITNKLLKNKTFAICTAYDGMAKYFPQDKIHLTGNPIRTDLFTNLPNQKASKEKFGLNPNKPVILSVGGSQGSRTLNNTWIKDVKNLIQEDIQLIWQTGKLEWNKINALQEPKHPNIHITEFIYDMNTAYAAADVIVSRAGAMAISELTLVGKPLILVPLPTAAEDHQTKNAQNLVDHKAAKMVKDDVAVVELSDAAITLSKNETEKNLLSKNIKELAKPNAAEDIADIIVNKLNNPEV
ncbi:undecaprenyldiphospho-muramoylpentapeptide beta-N-acetylglucosaminyltransferase [Flavobacteriaceae bacterium Ap0902]|nr:undecaprenyldiphospho-muramoylpentapeptide beta-N-acetylglucosaminyltransferase [Flavobacteriaceae bacterium Ap0902]